MSAVASLASVATRLSRGSAPAKTRRAFAARQLRATATEEGAKKEENFFKEGLPAVIINNTEDPLATVVTVAFGDVLGQLLDTAASLKSLGLNIVRAEVSDTTESGVNKFYITDARTSEKITKSKTLELIRMTIINNMLQYHPEAADYLVEGQHIEMPGDRDADANPLGARVAPAVKTSVVVDNTSGARQSKLIITTTDRPGLLVDIVATLKDLSLNVISAEIDTIGPKAYDIVYVTYQGGALNKSMIELVTNALTYHLTRRDIENKNSESY